MRIKSYFAKSVNEAIAQAQEELGPEALLLNTRKVTNEAGHPNGYEVVLGVTDAESPAPVQEVPPAPEEKRPPQEDMAGELGRLYARMEEIRGLLEQSARNQVNVGRMIPPVADLYARLAAADVDSLLSKEIADCVQSSILDRGFEAARFDRQVRAELERRVTLDSRLGVDGSSTVVALVGPTGAGKTTSLMKLAAREVAGGRAVRLLSMDTARVAPQMQLQYFASEHGIAFATVPSIGGLPAMVEEARKKELVLIDTPGYAGHDDRTVEVAAGVLASCPEVDVHMVAPGYMKSNDLRRSIRRYEAFRPAKLLVTKLDETQTFGSVYSGAAWAGLSLSFLANGPAIPNDIRTASLEDFVAMVLDRSQALAQRVA
jgi:flagellar biosynthesis protein FlhF